MTPPAAVRQAMDAQVLICCLNSSFLVFVWILVLACVRLFIMQAEAERHKRAHILDSEGRQQSDVNIAMGQKQAQILHAEGVY